MGAIDSTTTVRTDDGVAIAYAVRGDGPRQLLFLHGWAGSGAFFDETLARLDLTGLRAITVDVRGHGRSDKAGTGYTLDRLAADALAVADHLDAATFVVVGFSMSAKFAQYLATVAPERVAGLILVAGAPASEVPIPAEMHQDWVSRAGDRGTLLELERMFITQPVPAEVVERWLDDAIVVPPVALDETLKVCAHTSFVDRLATVRTPTLVIGGSQDPLFTPEALRLGVVAPLAGARLVVLDSNHDVPIEQPGQLAALIEAFLAGLGSFTRSRPSATPPVRGGSAAIRA